MATQTNPTFFNKLGSSLNARFERLGNLEDLNKSISITEHALRFISDGHINKSGVLNNLGSALFYRFERLGDLDNLNRSISIVEDAIHHTPDGDLEKPVMLNNLGNYFRTRFDWLGDLEDLNRSILVSEDAVSLTPTGTPDKPWMMNNLGNSLLSRFERLGDLGDLNRSISIREDALPLTPNDDLARPFILNNLSNSLRIRFEQRKDLDDLKRAISIGEDAVHLTPDGYPGKPFRLNNLAASVLRRFEQFSNVDDINRAVLMVKDAAHLIPFGHPDKPLMLKNLGDCLHTRFELLNDHIALKEATSLYALAALSITGPAHVRFDAASMWAKTAKIERHPSLLEAYNVVLGLLPELTWLGLSISDRHHQLLRAGKIVRDAAAAAISSGQPAKAVQWLEQGRSIIWGQLLNLRSPVDMLKSSYPELANKLLFLSAQLERSGTRANYSRLTASSAEDSLQSVADQAHQNAYDRQQLLKQIRGLKGFSLFLLPKTIRELSEAGKQGPVVLLNVSNDRCDALILMPGLDDEVMHISLTDFTPKDAMKLGQSFGHLVGRGTRLGGRLEGDIEPEAAFEQIILIGGIRIA
ncbi:hypothetical protein B0H13DRAFT_2506787 [Mycena leptocephala]|nr:hypothetical protein B0H13DRAFT_2506787 [Mycena leptocephala]